MVRCEWDGRENAATGRPETTFRQCEISGLSNRTAYLADASPSSQAPCWIIIQYCTVKSGKGIGISAHRVRPVFVSIPGGPRGPGNTLRPPSPPPHPGGRGMSVSPHSQEGRGFIDSSFEKKKKKRLFHTSTSTSTRSSHRRVLRRPLASSWRAGMDLRRPATKPSQSPIE